MKYKISIITALFLALTACTKEEPMVNPDKPNETKQELEYKVEYNKEGNFHIVYNLYAPGLGDGYRPEQKGGPFVKFDLEKNEISESETDWDIAFRWSTIIVNGGEKTGLQDEPKRTAQVAAYIKQAPFEQVHTLEADLLCQDKKGSLAIIDDVIMKNGLWSYNMTEHYVLPIPGRVMIVKARSGKVFKIQMKSFYKGSPKTPKKGDPTHSYYTFRYAELK